MKTFWSAEFIFWIKEITCFKKQVLIQGVSHWNVSYKLTLTDRNMQVRFCLKVSVYSWDWGIWVSSTSFQKSNIFWPQQPPTEKETDIRENLYFWWFIPQKRAKIVLFWCFEKNIFWQNHESPFWISAPFLSEAVEASLCYFFENWLMKLKFFNLRNIQIPSNKI